VLCRGQPGGLLFVLGSSRRGFSTPSCSACGPVLPGVSIHQDLVQTVPQDWLLAWDRVRACHRVIGFWGEIMAQRLTGRECQVLRLMLRGMANKEIAVELCITVKTVEYHITNVLGKLGAANRTQAVLAALEQGLLDSRDLQGRHLSEDGKD
jgi:DNA-binding CsgD family transcriptional regulator